MAAPAAALHFSTTEHKKIKQHCKLLGNLLSGQINTQK